MHALSKSRYTAFRQCPKNLWLKIYKPEEAVEDPSLQARLDQGNEVGDLAMQYFGDYVEVTTYSHGTRPFRHGQENPTMYAEFRGKHLRGLFRIQRQLLRRRYPAQGGSRMGHLRSEKHHGIAREDRPEQNRALPP